MNKILHSNNGIVTLPDGTVIYVVEIQFSHNGIDHWEDKYNPEKHIYEEDGVSLISGHKYMRLRKSGHTEFEKPMYITAVDGDHPVIRRTEDFIQYKLSKEEILLFEEFREEIESNIESWQESDDGYGNNLSWRGWGRGFNGINNIEKFEKMVNYINNEKKKTT